MKEKMKKILCMLVLATVLLNTCAISVFALPEDNEATQILKLNTCDYIFCPVRQVFV